MKRVHIVISGRVQRVAFRLSTKWRAKKLNIKGWVRNLDNGDVEVVAEGNEQGLNKLIGFCRKGPILARVNDIKIKYSKTKNEFKDFHIRW